jgi:hypothetical protein
VSITTYAELQTAAASWLNRSDLTAQVPDFIALAEAKFKRDLAGGTTIPAISGGSNWLLTSHPDVYLYGTLMEAAPYLHDDARVPVWKSLLAEAIEGVRRTRTSTAYDLTTYSGLQAAIKGWLDRFDIDAVALITLAEARLKRALAGAPTITALSGGTNWLFTSHPDVYLYAALVEAEPYLKNDERIPVWKAQLEERIGEVRRSRTATAYDLTSYAGLQTAIKGWLDRTDIDPAVLIAMAESSLRRDLTGMATISSLATAGSNWVLNSHADLYLYASLVEAAPYLGEDPRLAVWKSERAERLAAVRNSGLRTQTAYDLTTYVGLVGAIKGWLNRADLDGAVPSFVTLAEKSLARDPRIEKLASATFTIDADDEAVPADFHTLVSWVHDSSGVKGSIEIVGAGQLPEIKARLGDNGIPRYAAILDGKFRFAPVPDATYSTKITYQRTLGSAEAATSWLFTAAPDIYLYACLVESAPYLGEDPRVATWASKLEAEIEKLRRETWNTHFSGTMVRRPRPIGG